MCHSCEHEPSHCTHAHVSHEDISAWGREGSPSVSVASLLTLRWNSARRWRPSRARWGSHRRGSPRAGGRWRRARGATQWVWRSRPRFCSASARTSHRMSALRGPTEAAGNRRWEEANKKRREGKEKKYWCGWNSKAYLCPRHAALPLSRWNLRSGGKQGHSVILQYFVSGYLSCDLLFKSDLHLGMSQNSLTILRPLRTRHHGIRLWSGFLRFRETTSSTWHPSITRLSKNLTDLTFTCSDCGCRVLGNTCTCVRICSSWGTYCRMPTERRLPCSCSRPLSSTCLKVTGQERRKFSVEGSSVHQMSLHLREDMGCFSKRPTYPLRLWISTSTFLRMPVRKRDKLVGCKPIITWARHIKGPFAIIPHHINTECCNQDNHDQQFHLHFCFHFSLIRYCSVKLG